MKKIIVLPAIALFISVFLFSCQKEISLENTANRGTAKYSLNGGTGSCTGALVSGEFIAKMPATSANTVKISVSVDSIGTYAITTNTINGVTYSGSGVFTSTGTQDIILSASGTPAAAGTFEFTPVTDGCAFSITVAGNAAGSGGTAVYNFSGGTSSCTDAVVNGTLTAGTVAATTNTVVLKVTVNTIGTYTVSTAPVNGITFAGSGNFTATGEQTLTLTASGTPVAPGVFSYRPGNNACAFDVTVKNSGTTPGGGGAGSGNFLKCKIDGVLTNFNAALVGYYIIPPNAGIPYSISAQGKNSDVAGSVEELWVSVADAKSPTTGLYKNLTISSNPTDRGCGVGFYPTGFPNLYWGPKVFNPDAVTVTITSVTSNSAAGTFQGILTDQNGVGSATKAVTEGEFRITF